ncbi:hypothetical protein Tco_1032458 [Tanacetum coccineum]|uniref:Uncharacterized protein n=1 Tax=Tanacetum coccineum TaxID=301880 RepID=A0ABQ5GBW6_9ASTR
MEQMTTLRDLVGQVIQKKEEEKRIAEEQAAEDRYWRIPICYDDDEDDIIAITPVLPIKETDNSLSMGDKHLDNIPETESDEFIKLPTPLTALNENSEILSIPSDDNPSSDDDSTYGEDIDYVDASPTNVEIVSLEVVEIIDPEVERIDDDILLTIKDDTLPFYVDNDHFKEKSSGSTTTHVDFSQYDSFIFDLSNDHFPPADRSDLYHEEFADELAHIMSLPNLECFKFKIEPDLGELTSIDLGIRKDVSTTNVNVPLEDDQSSLFAYVVWIFLAFLTYPVVPPYLLSTGNEDTIFDPGIPIYLSFMPDVSHRNGTFMKFNVYPNRLNESPMMILPSTCFPMDCPDCEELSKRIFKKRSKKKAKNKQIQAREGKDQVKSKSKVIRMKKIQLQG